MNRKDCGDLPLFSWRPPAPQVLAFPLTRRRTLASRQAAYMARLRPQKAAEHLERQIETQRRTLLRYGVEAAQVEREVAALATQIKCELARYMVESGEIA
jgi:hypothetical protein